MKQGSAICGFLNALLSDAALGAHFRRSSGCSSLRKLLVALLLTGVVAAPGVTGAASVSASGSGPVGTHCCGDCNNDGAVGVSELVSLVRDAIGLAAAPGCGFDRLGNCGQFPGQSETSIANLQTAVVRSLRGCSGCPVYFGKSDFASGCVFRGNVELTDGRRLPAEMLVGDGFIELVLTEDEGGLTIFFDAVAIVGRPTPTPRVRPGREFVGNFQIGPEDVLLSTNGRLVIGEDGTTLTVDFDTPRFGVGGIVATYSRECIWSIREGGCQ